MAVRHGMSMGTWRLNAGEASDSGSGEGGISLAPRNGVLFRRAVHWRR